MSITREHNFIKKKVDAEYIMLHAEVASLGTRRGYMPDLRMFRICCRLLAGDTAGYCRGSTCMKRHVYALVHG
jgi:ribosomal protein S14